jgi:hypothetical protein
MCRSSSSVEQICSQSCRIRAVRSRSGSARGCVALVCIAAGFGEGEGVVRCGAAIGGRRAMAKSSVGHVSSLARSDVRLPSNLHSSKIRKKANVVNVRLLPSLTNRVDSRGSMQALRLAITPDSYYFSPYYFLSSYFLSSPPSKAGAAAAGAARSRTPTNSRMARVPESPRRGLANRMMRV